MKMYQAVELLLQHPQSWHQMKVSGQVHTLAALFSGEEPLVPIGQEAGWVPDLIQIL
jgi:hypothetical protein